MHTFFFLALNVHYAYVLHLYCSAQLSMSTMEKHCRNKIITVVIVTAVVVDDLLLLLTMRVFWCRVLTDMCVIVWHQNYIIFPSSAGTRGRGEGGREGMLVRCLCM